MVLAIESSCDETSVAVVDQGVVLSNVVASQTGLHAEYGGVVPELAVREHLRNLIPVARAALSQSGASIRDMAMVAATRGPGLPSALMAGFTAGRALAFALDRPFYGVHHHEAHLYSAWVRGQPLQACWHDFEPNVSLIVSGGHTLLVHVPTVFQHRVLGSTLDDAAGECFDKVAKLLGLPYPGGPVLDRLAEEGRAEAYEFPRSLIHEPNDDFSFSGLKTSVRYFLQKHPGLVDDGRALRDLCASVREAIVEVLVAKTMRAARRTGVRCVTASGGVTCNRALRRALTQACIQQQMTLRMAEPSLCTDNAAMVGLLAERRWQAGICATALDEEASPGWPLESLSAC